MKIYTTTETAEILQVSDRTVRTYCQMWNVPKLKRSYQITDEHITAFKNYINEGENEVILDKIRLETEAQTQQAKKLDLKEAIELITVEAMHKDLQYRVFTNEEYDDVIGKMELVEHQQEQIKYLRERIAKQDAMLQGLAKQIEQRTFIEAKEKGLDKE